MTKKTRKEKELSRLRREIEILKAQASRKNYSPATSPASGGTPPLGGGNPASLKALEIRRVDPKYIKKDLLKTALLSVLALAIILVLYLMRSQIPFL